MTRVLIVTGVRLYREGLAQLLTARGEFEIIGIESTGRDAVKWLDDPALDVALVDVGIADLHEIASTLGERPMRVPVVALGVADSDSDVLACAEMGIAGYVTRECSIDELAAALHSAADGELICSPRTAGTLIRRVAELAAERDRRGSAALLTRREREVARLICDDLTNKEIATRLGIEVATVKNHVHSVLDKLRVHRRSEAVRLLGRPSSRPARSA
jgi:DNA-binding NarL/FixJ family response regulator